MDGKYQVSYDHRSNERNLSICHFTSILHGMVSMLSSLFGESDDIGSHFSVPYYLPGKYVELSLLSLVSKIFTIIDWLRIW